jgi:YVTN family beta-propeller protein
MRSWLNCRDLMLVQDEVYPDHFLVKVTRTKSVPVNGRLHNVYVTPDSKYAVTGSIRTGIVTVIDLATEQPAWELKLDKRIRPMAIEANPDGSTKRIFVQLSDFNGFAVVDFAARKEVARIQLPPAKVAFETDGNSATPPSHGIGIAPDGKTAYVSNAGLRSVPAIDTKSTKLIAVVGVGEIPERINTLNIPDRPDAIAPSEKQVSLR